MVVIVEVSEINEGLQRQNRNILIEGGLLPKEFSNTVKDHSVSHLVLDEFIPPKLKRGTTYHYKLIDMIAYPIDYQIFFEETPGYSFLDIKCSNYGLALDKFGRNVGNKLDYISHKGEDNLQYSQNNNWKEILDSVRSKQEKLFDHYENKGVLIQLFQKQNWRMVLNLGATTAYNNGFLLHKIYGVPYLPGQAVKGVLRHYVITTYFDSKEVTAWKNRSFRMLFGNEEVEAEKKNGEVIKANQGKAIFFDIFPADDKFKIEADIMNPHNTKYYDPSNLSDYPNDTTDPSPIKFLTLKDAKFNLTVFVPKEYKNTEIDFCVSKIDSIEKCKWANPNEALTQLLEDAMKLQGIGAKTNLGYGRLVKDHDALEALKEEKEEKKKEEESKKKQIEAEKAAALAIEKQKENAKTEGIASYLSNADSYGAFKEAINSYKSDIETDDNILLPKMDHQPILDKLTELMRKKPPKYRKNYKSDSVKNYLAALVGAEKIDSWIKEHFPN